MRISDQLLEVINNLHEENMFLKEQRQKDIKDFENLLKLQLDNEQLKKENQVLKETLKNQDINEISEYEKFDERTDKRFEFRLCSDELYYFYIIDNETGKEYKYLIDDDLLKLLNELHEENKRLKSENNMLKVTIGRNEAYINRLQNKGKWDINAYKYNPKGVR